MKYTKILAIAAVAFMLAVPVLAMMAGDADVSAADPKFKVEDGTSAKMIKTDKELKDLDNEKKYFFADNLVNDFASISGVWLDAFGPTPMSDLDVKIIEMERGEAYRNANNGATFLTVDKDRAEFSWTYKNVTFYEKELFSISLVKSDDALKDFKAYFGDINGKDVKVTVKFDYGQSMELGSKYVNIDDGSLVCTGDTMKVNMEGKVDNAKIEIGDKTMVINVNSNCKAEYGIDYKFDSKTKLDDKADKVAWTYSNTGENSVKYKFGNDEKLYSESYSEKNKESDSRMTEALKKYTENAKNTKVSELTEFEMPTNGMIPVVQNANVKCGEASWSDMFDDPTDVEAYKNAGLVVSEKYEDVQSVANSINASSGKSPVLFIVIAVVAVVVVAGVVFVVMKKKSA